MAKVKIDLDTILFEVDEKEIIEHLRLRNDTYNRSLSMKLELQELRFLMDLLDTSNNDQRNIYDKLFWISNT